MDKVNLIVVGAGLMGERHVSVYSQLQNANIVCVCDKDLERSKYIAQKYNINAYSDDIDSVISKYNFDAASICTPDSIHKDVSMTLMKAGKHILIEKPLATTMEDANEMLQCSENCKVKVMVGYSVRFMNPFNLIKDQLESIGKPVLIKIDWFNRANIVDNEITPANQRDSIISFLATHPIDYIRYLLGDIDTVYCDADTFSSKQKDLHDTASIMMRLKNKCMAYVSCSWGTIGTTHRVKFSLELTGQKGIIKCSSLDERLEIMTSELGYSLPISYDWVPMEKEKLAHFLKCIINDEQVGIDIHEGYKSLQATLAAIESCQTNNVIKLG